MITTARQLKDLIRNMSKKKSADAQLLMRNYMMERFLELWSLLEIYIKLHFQINLKLIFFELFVNRNYKQW